MGLDIYVHRIKRNQLVSDNISEIREKLKEDSKESFSNEIWALYDALRKSKDNSLAEDNPTIYFDAYKSFINDLSNLNLFKRYTFLLDKFSKKVLSLDEVKDLLDYEVNTYYALEDAYFRKVNFIRRHFENLLVDEECLVDEADVANLVDICKLVLDNKGDTDFAMAHLPTQSGFFFGSTEYDDWYYHNVEDCIKQLTDLINSLEEGDKVLFSFSW